MLILTDSNSVWSTVLIMLLRSCLRSKEKSFLMSESGMHTEGEVTVCVPYTWCTWYPSRAYRHLRTKWYVVTVAQLCSGSRQDHYIGSFLLLLLTSTHLWLPENWTSQYVYTNLSQTVRKMKLTPPLAQLHRYQTLSGSEEEVTSGSLGKKAPHEVFEKKNQSTKTWILEGKSVNQC